MPDAEIVIQLRMPRPVFVAWLIFGALSALGLIALHLSRDFPLDNWGVVGVFSLLVAAIALGFGWGYVSHPNGPVETA